MNTTPANPGIQAVVLAGGGAFAAYEVGAMMALSGGLSAGTGYTPMEAQIFTGTSAGAVNAAIMTSQPGKCSAELAQYLERVWIQELSTVNNCQQPVFRFRANPFEYLNPVCLLENPLQMLGNLAGDVGFFTRDGFQRAFDFMLSEGSLETRLLDLLDLSVLISNEPLRRFVTQRIPFDGIRRSDKTLRIAATNWQTGLVQIFKNTDMTDDMGPLAILASAAIPGLTRPVWREGVPYVDGGVVMNTPLMPAIEAGADTLHVIYLDPHVPNIPIQKLQQTLEVFERLRTIGFAIRINEDIDHAREINRGLDLLQQDTAGLPVAIKDDFLSLMRTAARLEEKAHYKMVTIHRYHPRDELGKALGLINFDRTEIERFITRGFDDVAGHSCFNSDCIVPLLDKF